MKNNNGLLIIVGIVVIVVAIFLLKGKTGLFAVTPMSGAVAYFPLTDLKEQVTGINSVAYNGPLSTSGFYGGAYRFDGVDDYLSFPSSSSLQLQSLSLEAWVYPTAFQQGYIISKTGNYLFQLRANSTRADFQAGVYWAGTSGGTWDALVTDSVPLSTTLNSWHHYVFTYDNGVARLYLNGSLVASASRTPASLFNDNSVLTIGNGQDSTIGSRAFAGIIDEVYVYNRALSAGEVLSEHQEYLSGGISSDDCLEVACPDNCVGSVLKTGGYCNAGVCVYVSTNCPNGCSNSECSEVVVDPCLNVVCSDKCSGNSLLKNGVCSLGSCHYDEVVCQNGCLNAICNSPVVTPDCTVNSQCIKTVDKENDCSPFWTSGTTELQGTCTSGKCTYSLTAEACTDTEIFLQDYKWFLIGGVLVVLLFVFMQAQQGGGYRRR
jgi:hypothetical protein